jgi:hypothetical protein
MASGLESDSNVFMPNVVHALRGLILIMGLNVRCTKRKGVTRGDTPCIHLHSGPKRNESIKLLCIACRVSARY